VVWSFAYIQYRLVERYDSMGLTLGKFVKKMHLRIGRGARWARREALLSTVMLIMTLQGMLCAST
jgi:hypothetical protein